MASIGNDRRMDPRANTQLRAMERAKQIIMQVWGSDSSVVICDPELVPPMAERADAEAAEFHKRAATDARARAEGRRPILDYDTCDTNYDPNATHEQGVVKIWRVGGDLVYVVRDRWHDRIYKSRIMNPAEEMSSLLQVDRDVDDYHRFGDKDNPRYVRDYELRCNVNIAHDCTAPLSPDVNDYGGGTTRWLAVDKGTVILLFRCCRACEVLTGKIAANSRERHVMAARAGLPPGAMIMPNPEPDVNPDAWA